MPTFPDEVVNATIDYINAEHAQDALLIAQAFGDADAETCEMVGLDTFEGTWVFTVAGDQRLLDVPWPSGEVTDVAAVRAEIVTLYERACLRLGVTPRRD